MSRRSILSKKFSVFPRGTNFVPFSKSKKVSEDKKMDVDMKSRSRSRSKSRGRSRTPRAIISSSRGGRNRNSSYSLGRIGKRKFKKTRTVSFSRSRSRSRSNQFFSKFDKNVRRVISKEVTADNSYRNAYVDWVQSVSTTGNAAQQLVFCTNQSAISALAGSAPALTANTYLYGLLDDPIVLGQIASAISNTSNTLKFCRKSCSNAIRMVNGGTSNVEIRHYRCQARYDQTKTPALIVSDQVLGGFALADATAPGTKKPAVAGELGTTMFMNPYFTSQYKIKSVKKWELKPGAAKKLLFKYNKPRWYSEPRYAFRYLLRNQCFSLFIINGTFCAQPSAAAGLKYGVADAHVGIEVKIEYHYTFEQDASIATGSNTSVPGFTEGININCPGPVILNQPLSSINTVAYGGATDIPVAISTGTRVYATFDAGSVPELDVSEP